MLTPFFALGMIAPNRQRSFRTAVVAHVSLVSTLALALLYVPAALPVAGQVLLVAGIVEGAMLVGGVVYLLVGVLAGENLRLWLTGLPDSARWWVLEVFAWMHTDNPFAVLQYWLGTERSVDIALGRMAGLELLAVGALGLVT